jgi:uncharacterized iron-regulated protein
MEMSARAPRPADGRVVTVTASKALDEQIKGHQRVIARLKREIFGIDRTYRSPYIKEFFSEFKRFKRICPVGEIIDRAARSDIVYVGDYHPLDASQDWVLRLMDELSRRGTKVVLALEMLYVHQQEFLDRWMKGTISEEAFLDAIDYGSEWGFSWRSFKRIFERAKDPFIPIFGIDSEPRDNLRHIRTRDRLAAQRIATIRSFFPDHTILVVIGESHLASGHLPAEVHRLIGRGPGEIVIVQNIDEIYWRLLRQGNEDAEAVAIDGSRYCVFTASPLLKYEAYRDAIEGWFDGEEEERQTRVIHEMIDGILAFLKVGRRKLRVTVRDGWRVPLEAIYPEVHCRKTYHAAASYLRGRKASTRLVAATLESLRNYGTAYVPALNSCVVVRFNPAYVAREAARFVLAAMRDALGKTRPNGGDRWDAFYDAVIDEALACFGSKIVHPMQDCLKEDLIVRAVDARGVVRESIPRRSLRETRTTVRLFKAALDGERRGDGARGTTRGAERILGPGFGRHALVVRALGNRLGEALYHSFHAGRVRRQDIVELFRRPPGGPGEVHTRYLDLLDRCGELGRSPFARDV